jgi:hypothetical protein
MQKGFTGLTTAHWLKQNGTFTGLTTAHRLKQNGTFTGLTTATGSNKMVPLQV